MALRNKKTGTDRHISEKLSSLRAELTLAYGDFDRESDSDMVEARIYNINSLSAQYAHYLNLARREGLTAEPEVRSNERYFPGLSQQRRGSK